MLLIDYPSIRWEEIPDYYKKAIWKRLREYIDAHSQILVDECPGYEVKYISRF